MFSPPLHCRRPNGVLSAGLRHHQGPRPLAVFRACPLFVRIVSALILTAFVLTGSPLLASNLYWDTNGTTADSGDSIVGVWGTDNFWNTDPTGGNAGTFQTATTSADDLFISAGTSATGVNTITISGAQAAQSITFNNGVVSLAGTSTPSLTLGAGGLTMNSTLDGTLSLGATLTSVILAGSQSWTNNSSQALSVSSTTLITGTAGAGEVNTWTISGTGTGASTFAGAIGDGANGGTLAVKVNTPNAKVTFSAANTYTGSTTLEGGTLSISADNRLGAAPAVFTADSLVFNGGTLETTAAFTLNSNRGISLGSTGTIMVKGGNFTMNSIIADLSGPGALTIVGTASTALYVAGGLSTYSGGTTFGVGSYSVPTVSSVGTPGSLTSGPFGTGTLILAGGTMRSTTGGARTLGNALSITADSFFNTITSETTLTLSGTATLVGTRNLNVAIGSTVSTTSLVMSGAIGDGGSGYGLTKSGAGVLTLSGTNTYTGPTSVTAGRMDLSTQGSLYNNTPASWTDTNITVASGATLGLNVGGTGEFTAADVALLSGLGTGVGGFLSGSTLRLNTTNATGGSFAYSTNLDNPNAGANVLGLDKVGSGTLTLSGSNGYSGTTTIAAGTLALGTLNALAGGGSIKFTGGNLQFSSNNTTDYSSRIAGSTSALNINTNGQNVIFAGVLNSTNTGGLAKFGTGNLTLSGSNTFSGGVSANAGSLIVAHSNALGTGNKTITGNSATGVYALDGSSGDVSLSSAISVVTTGAGLFNIAGNNTIAGVITLTGGAGGSTWQSNSGTLTVTNSITPVILLGVF